MQLDWLFERRSSLKVVLSASLCLLLAAAAQAQIRITEVAPWSSGSGNTSLNADWFELTNFGSSAVNITGWRVDDSSAAWGSSLALNGITNIDPGESVIFIETASGLATQFKSLWFGGDGSLPSDLQIGRYSGSGIGLSTDGDGLNIFSSSTTVEASVSFGASTPAPFQTFDNSEGLNGVALTQLSVAGVNGAFTRPSGVGQQFMTGSPGTIPEPTSFALVALGSIASLGVARRRRK